MERAARGARRLTGSAQEARCPMHLRKTNLGGQRPAPVPSLGDQELPAEETVFRVLIRLSDRKAEWIQRGTEKVSLPGLPGGISQSASMERVDAAAASRSAGATSTRSWPTQ